MHNQAVVDSETSRIDRLFRSTPIGNGDGAPLYREVERYLRDLISSGQLVPGDLIPAEPQLASALKVSQGTVKKAIAKALSISPGAPIVALTRRTFTTQNRILEFRQTKGRADRFSYKTEIR